MYAPRAHTTGPIMTEHDMLMVTDLGIVQTITGLSNLKPNMT